MNQKSENIGRLIRSAINSVDESAEVILYGSRARGDERADSDWDILILTDYPIDQNKEQNFRNHLYELELDTGEAFSVFVYSKNNWKTQQRISPFYQNVIREGVHL